jgi:hypothetical protein
MGHSSQRLAEMCATCRSVAVLKNLDRDDDIEGLVGRQIIDCPMDEPMSNGAVGIADLYEGRLRNVEADQVKPCGDKRDVVPAVSTPNV